MYTPVCIFLIEKNGLKYLQSPLGSQITKVRLLPNLKFSERYYYPPKSQEAINVMEEENINLQRHDLNVTNLGENSFFKCNISTLSKRYYDTGKNSFQLGKKRNIPE